jgi:hypothetical protein
VANGSTELKRVERLDPSIGGGQLAWQRVADMGSARCSLGAAGLRGELYAVGGQSGRSTFRSCEVINPSHEVSLV